MHKVGFVHSAEYLKLNDQLPSNPGRASMVYNLIEAYGLTKQMLIIQPRSATDEELCQFNDEDFVKCLVRLQDINEKEDAAFGLQDDCPRFPVLEQYVRYLCGSAIDSAQALVTGQCDLVYHWQGGRHHAQSDCARGFCYVNDIVVSVLTLRRKFSRVLCIDLDVHHGDGTQEAFLFSDSVMCVSMHLYEPGFYPTTGSALESGKGKGVGKTLNIPLKRGLSDTNFERLFQRMWFDVKQNFEPQAVVLVCGADGLAGDPTQAWNLTSLHQQLQLLLESKLPTLVLGAGGYNHQNTARLWAQITAIGCGMFPLPDDIPELCLDFLQYGPCYSIRVEAGNVKDDNGLI